MKIDKRKPLHWCYLALSAMYVLIALVLRPFRRRRTNRKRVIFYGHKLSGNLLGIYRFLRDSPTVDVEVVFLTLDPAYHRELNAQGESCLLATSPRCVHWLITADALVSDHGLHALLPLLHLSDIKFFDVWHGIPFKGFDAEDFRVQHRYDETWVASPMLSKIYVDRFGFSADKVHTTGYARTDCLIRRDEDAAAIKERLGLDENCKVILFAPTWKQDDRHRSVFPFGAGEGEFMGMLSAVARRTGATVVVRTHLNSAAGQGAGQWPGVVHRPYARFPDTESLLLASDVLVCDWSSIAFDFLLLDRPVVFLNVEPPFAKGLSLDGSYRFGALAGDMDSLEAHLEACLNEPERYWREFSSRHAEIKHCVYGGMADGRATWRCVERLRHALSSPNLLDDRRRGQ